MFGVSWGEALVAGLVALLVLGPGKLPEAARTAGRFYGRLRRFLAEAQNTLKAEMDDLARPATPDAQKNPAADEDRRD
jgi:sec-independent protein translocase protein TatB